MTVVEAVFNGTVIARSEQTIFLEGNHYFPLEAVNCDYLRASRAKSLCPWKGIASYYDVQVEGEAGDAAARNAAWTYRHPSPLARKIKNHVAFWGAVTVVEAG